MSETVYLLLAFIGGLLLGGFFYGCLRWTVRRGLDSPRPAAWFLISYLVRMAVALVSFYAISAGSLPRLIACLFGFVFARFLVMRFDSERNTVALTQGGGHAT
jgi:F1F0 ATPase subunit 2